MKNHMKVSNEINSIRKLKMYVYDVFHFSIRCNNSSLMCIKRTGKQQQISYIITVKVTSLMVI